MALLDRAQLQTTLAPAQLRPACCSSASSLQRCIAANPPILFHTRAPRTLSVSLAGWLAVGAVHTFFQHADGPVKHALQMARGLARLVGEVAVAGAADHDQELVDVPAGRGDARSGRCRSMQGQGRRERPRHACWTTTWPPKPSGRHSQAYCTVAHATVVAHMLASMAMRLPNMDLSVCPRTAVGALSLISWDSPLMPMLSRGLSATLVNIRYG